MHQYSSAANPPPAHSNNADLIDHILRPPTYGWEDKDGNLAIPSTDQILNEFWYRLDIIRSKKNWLAFVSWTKVVLLLPCLFIFVAHYFSGYLLLTAFIYSMIVMGTHGTIWYHRYCTHKAYAFSNRFWRFFTRNLTISMIPEEVYVVSHHVHHAKADRPGDPYNAGGGFLYCFLADVNHQAIGDQMTQEEYEQVVRMMAHTGVRANTYRQYQKWGSVTNPGRFVIGWLLNWSFWALIFYWLGGTALIVALFGAAGFWAIGVRTFNYEGHGKGRHKHKEGIDFNRNDLSINQLWPGYVAGEWHNNHHLFPSSARSGFLTYQLDLAWCCIRLLKIVGAVKSYNDSKKAFLLKYKIPSPADPPYQRSPNTKETI